MSKIKAKEFPNKEFATKQDLFAELKKHEAKIIELKKAEILESHKKGQLADWFVSKKIDTDEATKSLDFIKEGFIYPIINTTRYFDSHSDVHFDNLWTKTVQDQAGKIYYVADHTLQLTSVIAYPKDVKLLVKNIPWSLVGKNYAGETQALIFEIPETEIQLQEAKTVIEKNISIQNSVRMAYVKIKLAMNSYAKEDVDYKRYFDLMYPLIANKEDVDEYGYFWGVEEAKIVKEGSMVLFGSNDATSIITGKQAASTALVQIKDEPFQNTHQNQINWENITQFLKN
jgi:hypothetical protein